MDFVSSPTSHRAYFFGNMYISQIQHGIQAAHVVTKMAVDAIHIGKYSRHSSVFLGWAEHGVTKILLNGGYQSNLEKINTIFEAAALVLNLPTAHFREEPDALNGAMTSVGIVVPEEVYNHTDTPDNIFDFVRKYFPEKVGVVGPLNPTVDELVAVVNRLATGESPDQTYGDWCKILYYTLKTGRLA